MDDTNNKPKNSTATGGAATLKGRQPMHSGQFVVWQYQSISADKLQTSSSSYFAN